MLRTPTPPAGTKGAILIAAQDTFFATPPIADAGVMMRDLERSLTSGGRNVVPTIRGVPVAGHVFARLELPGTRYRAS